MPMFNEEAGASTSLGSVLAQREAPDEIALSINGGVDATPRVVRETLAAAGYRLGQRLPLADPGSSVERWSAAQQPRVTVVEHAAATSKADSINWLLAMGLLESERVIVVDGDTVLEPRFVAAIKDAFYQLRRSEAGGGRGQRFVLEDVAMQSGAVLSLGASRRPLARLVALARSAEYAFAALLRTGQSRRLWGPMFGRSRLFTVVGCGFATRASSFPMPSDTLTEDHDFTLLVQSRSEVETQRQVVDLDALGFTVVAGGRTWPLSAALGRGAEVTVRRTSNAVLVPRAQMRTEDPPNLVAYLRQVERWNVGALEAVSKRVQRRSYRPPVSANVGYAYASAQVENLVGLALLLAAPVLLGLGRFLPSLGVTSRGLLLWLAADLVLTSLLVAVGFFKLRRASGRGRLASLTGAAAATITGALPLLALKGFNALAYLVALTRVVPAHVARARRGRQTHVESQRVSVVWERPGHMGGRLPARAAGLAVTLLLWGVLAFGSTALLANVFRPGYHATWALIYTDEPVDQRAHLGMPLADDVGSDEHAFCSPDPATDPDNRQLGGAGRGYQPLSPWGHLMLARLAPLLSHLEDAATRYDLDPAFLLKVLINESFLDPLAVGPTDDIGLAQMTSDALTLLKSVSSDPASELYNPQLFGRDFSLFDPLFSLCGGAAKLAWAASQPGGDDERLAYARYINPLDGVVKGAVHPRSAVSVEAMVELDALVSLLGATVAAFRADPLAVSEPERLLLDVAARVDDGSLGLDGAYAAVAELVAQFEIDDRLFYAQVLGRLYRVDERLALAPSR